MSPPTPTLSWSSHFVLDIFPTPSPQYLQERRLGSSLVTVPVGWCCRALETSAHSHHAPLNGIRTAAQAHGAPATSWPVILD